MREALKETHESGGEQRTHGQRGQSPRVEQGCSGGWHLGGENRDQRGDITIKTRLKSASHLRIASILVVKLWVCPKGYPEQQVSSQSPSNIFDGAWQALASWKRVRARSRRARIMQVRLI